MTMSLQALLKKPTHRRETESIAYPLGIGRSAAWAWFAVASVVIVAAALRLHGLDRAPLWIDEGMTWWFVSQDWGHMFLEMPTYENIPPLYYAFVKLSVQVFGDGEFALRLPSVVAGVLAVLAMVFAGRRAGGVEAGWAFGLAAATVAAFWRFQLVYSAEARPYAFCTLAMALILVGGLRTISAPEAMKAPRDVFLRRHRGVALGLATLALGMALAPWSHLVGVVASAAAGLFLFLWWIAVLGADRRAFWKLAAMAGLAALLYLPNVPMLASTLSRNVGAFWIPTPSLKDLVWMTTVTVWQPIFPVNALTTIPAALLIGAGAFGLWRLLAVHGAQRPAMMLFVLWLMGAFWLMMVAITYLMQPVLLPRTLIFLQPPLFLLLGAAPWAFTRRRTLVTSALAILLVFGAAPGGFKDYKIIAQPRHEFEAFRAIAASDAPDAPVILVPNTVEPIFQFYEKKLGVALSQIPYPAAFPTQFQNPPRMTEELAAGLLAAAGNSPTVWVFVRRPRREDPDRHLYRALEAAGYVQRILINGDDMQDTLSRFDRAFTPSAGHDTKVF